MQRDTSAVSDIVILLLNDNNITVTYPTKPINMINMSINNSHFVRCLNEKKETEFHNWSITISKIYISYIVHFNPK